MHVHPYNHIIDRQKTALTCPNEYNINKKLNACLYMNTNTNSLQFIYGYCFKNTHH